MSEVHNNPYLALRRSKIARNEARLLQLGLVKASSFLASRSETAVLPSSSQSRPSSRQDNPDKPTVLRRSTRRKTSPESLFEPDEFKEQILHSPRPSKRSKQESTLPALVFPPQSARSMALNVAKLLYGDGNIPGFLGRYMTQTGKNHVMMESARLGVESNIVDKPISFNKYSGVQQWGNDVLFLWVNLNAPKRDVVNNEFLDGGRRVTWFGGSRMHDGSVAIRNLIRVGSSPDLANSPFSKGVILWCRQFIQNEKTFSPYFCLGRLSVSPRFAPRRPIAQNTVF
jgi:hypothetical protein